MQITIDLGGYEVGILEDVLNKACDQNLALSQLSATTDAERQMYVLHSNVAGLAASQIHAQR